MFRPMFRPMFCSALRQHRCIRTVVQDSHALSALGCASSLDEFDVHFDTPLGCGAFGAVYAGRHLKTNQDVAVKTMSMVFAPTQGISEPSDLEDGVLQEKQVFEHILESGASHPHVVELLGCFEGTGEEAHRSGLELPEDAVQEPVHYFVMERLAGKSLQECIEQSSGFDEQEVKNITRAICEGLEFLHQQGIVHRDIKPMNLLYSHGSSSSVLKLIDFSHAGVTPPDTSVEAAVFNKKLGTAGYTAPEVLLDMDPYSAKCDVFSLGCTVHAMLTNMCLPRRHPRIGIMTNWPESLSAQGRDLMSACLALRPEDRPSTTDILHDPWLR